LAAALRKNKKASTAFEAFPPSHRREYIEWLTIHDQKQAVIDDVERIRSHPLVPKSIPVYGFLYDVRSGKLIEVEGASAIGKAA